MLRRSAIRATVPAHPLIPGSPAVRGLLYRPSHINMYSRLAMIEQTQRTEEENRIYFAIQHPEPLIMFYIYGFCLFGTAFFWLFDVEAARHYTAQKQRNWEMAQIFEQHRDLIAETRRKYVPERPEVFDPPEGHVAWHDPTKRNWMH